MSYCFDFIETPISKFFVLDSPKGIHYLIKDNDIRVKSIIKLYNPSKGLIFRKVNIIYLSFLKEKFKNNHILK